MSTTVGDTLSALQINLAEQAKFEKVFFLPGNEGLDPNWQIGAHDGFVIIVPPDTEAVHTMALLTTAYDTQFLTHAEVIFPVSVFTQVEYDSHYSDLYN